MKKFNYWGVFTSIEECHSDKNTEQNSNGEFENDSTTEDGKI